MSRYVWRGGQFVHVQTGEPMHIPERDGICMPRVQGDIAEYRSPIDGTMITSRSERREDLKRNNCVEMDPPKRDKVFRTRKWAKGNRGEWDPNHRRTALTTP